ncbi:CLUMA_CG011722, isoform A [Clunio marinus]|uniref:CLUMA_CG011722, isoform A n=1 Tax=Clunio marinus TaxID=568069 RepID=A0A1J1IDR8_9DIPT|nr:CLUMA_CG011722, isoform A [Clunio marinus]
MAFVFNLLCLLNCEKSYNQTAVEVDVGYSCEGKFLFRIKAKTFHIFTSLIPQDSHCITNLIANGDIEKHFQLIKPTKQ